MADETNVFAAPAADRRRAFTPTPPMNMWKWKPPSKRGRAGRRDLEIVQLKEEAAQYKDRLLRTAADMENLRKRAEREKAEATLYAATNFARDLLSVADNMSRALAAVTPEAREQADDATKNLLAGVELTEKELLNVFQRYGIRKVETVGAKFDPNITTRPCSRCRQASTRPARSSRKCSPASPSASAA
jgi:hypothetical protein